ncbi:hypothetical protein D3C78_1846630 [compost metagenome]
MRISGVSCRTCWTMGMRSLRRPTRVSRPKRVVMTIMEFVSELSVPISPGWVASEMISRSATSKVVTSASVRLPRTRKINKRKP